MFMSSSCQNVSYFSAQVVLMLFEVSTSKHLGTTDRRISTPEERETCFHQGFEFYETDSCCMLSFG